LKQLLTVLAALALVSPCTFAATIRVPADHPTIQAAVEAAVDGDVVLIADGHYTGEGNRGIHFRSKKITLRSENGPENCIIDAEFTEGWPDQCVIYANEEEDEHTIIDGLTVTGGDWYGIYIETNSPPSDSPTIRNCIVTGNTWGIGLIQGNTLVETTRVVGNSDVGIYSRYHSRIVDCVIMDNDGSGLILLASANRVENCLIAGNRSGEMGGGVYCEWGQTTLRNCTIVDNNALVGGGLAAWKESDVLLENCIVAGNTAGDLGDQVALLDYYYYPDTLSPSLTVRYSVLQGETHVDPWSELITGPGVIDEDPLFVTGPLGDHYLSQTAAGQGADSPCVDTGDPASDPVHGTTRTDSVQDSGIVDMGFHHRDPDEGPLPETMITGGPASYLWANVPAVVFTYTGVDAHHPPSSLDYSWRLDDGPWSTWSPGTWAAPDALVLGSLNSFQVRARAPDGDIDPIPAERVFYHFDTWFEESYTRLVVGPGPGPFNPPVVRTSLDQWLAYGVMRYGVNLAAGNIDGDGPDEVITGPGPGAMFGPHVRCFGGNGTVIHGAGFLAYGTHKYGVNVATGDVEGDGYDEIITGAGPGAVFGPHVRGWNWDGGPTIHPMNGISYFAYGTLKWGVNVACGDIDGDGRDEIVTGAGPGAVFGPHVRGWAYDDGETSAMPGVSYLAFGTPRWGVNVACGDVDGDGIDEIITGAGPNPSFAAHVRAWRYDGSTVARMAQVDYFAYEDLRYGVEVSTADVDADGQDEILTMPGPGPENIPWLRAWNVLPGQVSLVDGYFDGRFLDAWLTHGGTVAGSKNGWE